MRKRVFVFGAVFGALVAGAAERWVYAPCHFWGRTGERHSLEYFTNVAARAKAAGYGGMLLSAHLDLSAKWPQHLSNQVQRAKAFCDGIGMEIIPSMWDVGYGGDCPGNWFESRTVEDMAYVRRGNEALFDPPPVTVRGGPTDRIALDGASGPSMPMRPARRFTLRKGRHYVMSVRVRSTDVPEKDRFQFIGFIPSVKGRSSYYASPRHAHDGEWHDLACELVAKSDEEVTMVFGHWGKVGRVEMTDFTVRERGIVGATRREGIPFSVRNAESGTVYEEGRDYAEVPPISVRGEGTLTATNLVLGIPAGSRIPEGARLLVTADTPDRFASGGHDQYAACMSNPDWYRRAATGAAATEHLLHPKKWFLCFDELRSANICAACRARNLDMAHLIGDCLTKQREIVRSVSPQATCYVWGDMLDPNHNANEGYAHTRGSYKDIAKCLPQDLVICPWWGEKAVTQADYWAANGFRMIAGAFYDDKSGKNAAAWRAAMRKHPESFVGWMYATWKYDYTFMDAFAKEMDRCD